MSRRTFPKTTYREALERAKERSVWIVDDIISASTTLLFGESKSGKSFLACALIKSLVTGENFLGKPVMPGRDFSIAVLWTDDNGDQEYSERIQTVMPEGHDAKVEFYNVGSMRTHEMWEDIFEQVKADGHDFVIIDNLTECLDGSINDDHVIRRFFEGVRLFVRAGMPVVIIGHSSDKTGVNGYKPDKPMGSAYITMAVRWRIFARRTRRGNVTLQFVGNQIEPYEMTLKHGAGARFEVVDVKDSNALKAATEARERQRSTETLDANLTAAQWVVAHCQGKGFNAASDALAGQFGGSKETYRTKLRTTGAVGKLLERQGEGDKTSWALAQTG